MRIELFHPIVIHFPLALLLLGSVLRLAHYFLRKSSLAKLSLSIAWSFLVLGVCFSWLAVITGEIAADIAENSLCNGKILDYHSGLAYTAASLFSIALVIDFIKSWMKKLYRNNLKNREFGQEAPQIFDSERVTIAEGQGTIENQKVGVRPTQPKTDSSGCFGIYGTLKVLTVLLALFYASATLILIIVGFLGGNLVYEQGAAVKKICQPSANSQTSS